MIGTGSCGARRAEWGVQTDGGAGWLVPKAPAHLRVLDFNHSAMTHRSSRCGLARRPRCWTQCVVAMGSAIRHVRKNYG
jgi:hypothetical protein